MSDDNENVPGTSGEQASTESESTTAPADDGAVTEGSDEISDAMADMATEESVLEDLPESTEETVSQTIQVIEAYGTGIIHTNLFGSFLICGTLIALVLWRKVHGTC